MRPRALLAITLANAVGVAYAQGVDDLEATIRRGVELRVERRDVEALALFEQAWLLSRTPRARAQMGWAEQALGRWVDAEAHLTDALAATDDPWIRTNAEALTASLREVRRRLGLLEVLGAPAGAHVEVDGREVGTLPLPSPVRVAAGTVTLRVWADGHAPLVREGVRVTSESLARESVTLTPAPTRSEPPATALPPAPSTLVAPPPPPAPREASPVVRGLAWGTIALGAVTLGVGAASWGLRAAAIDRYNAGHPARCRGTSYALAEESDAECRSDREASSTWQSVAIATTLAGPLLVGAGVALLLLSPTRARPSAFACAPGGLGLTCAAHF